MGRDHLSLPFLRWAVQPRCQNPAPPEHGWLMEKAPRCWFEKYTFWKPLRERFIKDVAIFLVSPALPWKPWAFILTFYRIIFFRSVCASLLFCDILNFPSHLYICNIFKGIGGRGMESCLSWKAYIISLPPGPECGAAAPLSWLFVLELYSIAEWWSKRLFITPRILQYYWIAST